MALNHDPRKSGAIVEEFGAEVMCSIACRCTIVVVDLEVLVSDTLLTNRHVCSTLYTVGGSVHFMRSRVGVYLLTEHFLDFQLR